MNKCLKLYLAKTNKKGFVLLKELSVRAFNSLSLLYNKKIKFHIYIVLQNKKTLVRKNLTSVFK